MIKVPPKITFEGNTALARDLQSKAMSLYNSAISGMGANNSVDRAFNLPNGLIKLHAYRDDTYGVVTGAIKISSLPLKLSSVAQKDLYITLMADIPPFSEYPYPPIAPPYQSNATRYNFLKSEIFNKNIKTKNKYSGGPAYQGSFSFNNEQITRYGGNWYNKDKSEHISWTYFHNTNLVVYTSNRFCVLQNPSFQGAAIWTPFAVKIDKPSNLGISSSIYDKAVIVFYLPASPAGFEAKFKSAIYLLKPSTTSAYERDAIIHIEHDHPTVFSNLQSASELSPSGFLRSKNSFACFEMASGGIQNTLEITCSADYSSISASVIDSRTFYYDPSRYCSMIEAEDDSYSYTYTTVSGTNHTLFAIKASSLFSPVSSVLIPNISALNFNPTSTLFTSSKHDVHIYQTKVSAVSLSDTFIRTPLGTNLVVAGVQTGAYHLTNYAINGDILFLSLSYPFTSTGSGSNAIPGSMISVNLKTYAYVDNGPRDVVLVEVSPGIFVNRRVPLGITKF